MEDHSIFVGRRGGTAFIRVIGRGSFHNAPNVQQFGEAMIHDGVEQFVIDLKDCAHLDSTFIGILNSFNAKLREQDGMPLVLVNLNPRNLEILRELGLSEVFQIQDTPVDLETTAFNALPFEKPSPKQVAETMLHAHESLLEENPDNAVKFQDVIAYLRDELHSSS